MTVSARTLSVLPNPWTCIDHLGRPCGTVPCDPHEHNPTPGARVGASPQQVVEVRKPRHIVVRGTKALVESGDYYPIWQYATEPVTIPNSAYYREQIVDGSLFAADEKTARECGILKPGAPFVPPAQALELARKTAIEYFDSRNGVGAFEQLRSELAEEIAAQLPPEEKPAPVAPTETKTTTPKKAPRTAAEGSTE